MRILVTGRWGQVARAIAASRLATHELIFASRPEFDLESPGSIETCVSRVHPELVISAAAFTSVDLAEEDAERADRVNAEAPAILAHAANAVGAPVIHLSTDYVFDGNGSHPWHEDSPIAPLSIYGLTKARGEEAIRAEAPKAHAIVRTAWVYSPWGRNFVRTMLQLAESGHQTIRVVADQKGNPTSAHCIAEGLDAIVQHLQAEGPEKSSGTYHLAGQGDASWADFAAAIFAASASVGGPSAVVEPISGSAYPTKAARPANSRLDCTKFKTTFGFEAAPWPQALQKVVAELRGIPG